MSVTVVLTVTVVGKLVVSASLSSFLPSKYPDLLSLFSFSFSHSAWFSFLESNFPYSISALLEVWSTTSLSLFGMLPCLILPGSGMGF